MSTKIQLSAHELALVQNAEWLLTKNRIIDRAIGLLGEVAHAVQPVLQEGDWPAELLSLSPKISKGEKYQGLPYVILDYPRLFGKEHIFAVRTLFWWGHFFSVTLHLRGLYRERYVPAILRNLSLLRQQDFYICIAEDEWQHDFSAANYRPLSGMENGTIEKILSGNEFCKLSARISLQHWDRSVPLLTGLYRVVFQSLWN